MHCQLHTLCCLVPTLHASKSNTLRQMTVFDRANYTAIFPVPRKISERPASSQSLYAGDGEVTGGCQPSAVLGLGRVTRQGRRIWKLPLPASSLSRGDVLAGCCPLTEKYALGEWVGDDVEDRKQGKCSAHATLRRWWQIITIHRWRTKATLPAPARQDIRSVRPGAEVSVWYEGDQILY